MRLRTAALLALLLTAAGCAPLQQEMMNVLSGVILVYGVFVIVFIVAVISALLFIFRKNPRAQRIWIPLANPCRRLVGLPRLYILPYKNVSQERELAEQAIKLAGSVRESLRLNTRLSAQKKAAIQQQAQQIPANIAQSLWKLERLRDLSQTLTGDPRRELEELDFKLQVQMEHSLHVLKNMPVNLLKLEVASEDRALERLVNDLTDSNTKMRDLAESYADLKQARARLQR